MTTDKPTLLQWNTGRQYSAAGQIIVARLVDDGALFYDRTREIDGFVLGAKTRAEIMAGYDYGFYADVPVDLIDEMRALKA